MSSKSRQTKPTEPPSIGRVRLICFALLLSAFTAAVLILNSWGRDWTRKAYEPVLLETVAEDLAEHRYGLAETKILQALRATPEYAGGLRETFAPELPVMPRLAAELGDLQAASETGPQLAPYQTLRETVPTDSDSVEHRYLRAVADFSLGDLEAAAREFTALAEAGEALPDSAYQLGRIKELEGEPDEALAWYETAVRASDSHLDAARAYLRLSQ